MSLGALARRLFHATGTVDTSVLYLTMFDSITPSVLPTGGSYAYAGYVDGLWPTYAEVKSRFPGHDVLSIAVFASGNAQCLDIENGDATIAEAPGWVERQIQLGVYRPVLYIQASNMKALEQAMAANHISPGQLPPLGGPLHRRARLRAALLRLRHRPGRRHPVDQERHGAQPRPVDAAAGLLRRPPHPRTCAGRADVGGGHDERTPDPPAGEHDLPHAVAYVRRAQALVSLVGTLNGLYGAGLPVDGAFAEITTWA